MKKLAYAGLILGTLGIGLLEANPVCPTPNQLEQVGDKLRELVEGKPISIDGTHWVLQAHDSQKVKIRTAISQRKKAFTIIPELPGASTDAAYKAAKLHFTDVTRRTKEKDKCDYSVQIKAGDLLLLIPSQFTLTPIGPAPQATPSKPVSTSSHTPSLKPHTGKTAPMHQDPIPGDSSPPDPHLGGGDVPGTTKSHVPGVHLPGGHRVPPIYVPSVLGTKRAVPGDTGTLPDPHLGEGDIPQ